jgi:hypothetical protein
MKIRIMGLPAEVDHTVRVLQENKELDVIEVNGPYPNRGNSRMVRVYVEAQQPDRYAIFDADTGTQHSGWMSRDKANEWLTCAQFAEKQPYWQGRQYNWQIRRYNWQTRAWTENHDEAGQPDENQQ